MYDRIMEYTSFETKFMEVGRGIVCDLCMYVNFFMNFCRMRFDENICRLNAKSSRNLILIFR